MAWERPRLRRKTHNGGIRAVAVANCATACLLSCVAIWFVLSPVPSKGLGWLLPYSAVLFLAGAGLPEKNNWAWWLSLISMIAGLLTVPLLAAAHSLTLYALAILPAFLLSIGFLLQHSVRRRFFPEFKEKDSAITDTR